MSEWPGRKTKQIDSALLARLDAERAERLSGSYHAWLYEDQRTCLFCSRALTIEQHVCAHCGAYAP